MKFPGPGRRILQVILLPAIRPPADQLPAIRPPADQLPAIRLLAILLLVFQPIAGSGQLPVWSDATERIPEWHVAERKAKASGSVQAIHSNPVLDNYDISFYGLDLEMDNRSDHIEGNVTILARVRNNPLSDFVIELYSGLEVERVLVKGEEMQFSHQGDELHIPMSIPLDTGLLIQAQIFYSGSTGAGMVCETDTDWGVPVTYTLSEPFYAKDWFPCKEDLGDKADSVHVFITTDYGLTAVSNGLHTGTTYFPNGKVRYEWKSGYPIAFYLISVAVADYREYNIEARPAGLSSPILIQNFVYDRPGCLDTYREQINATTAIMELYCELFGPYPFREEKYGHYLWPWGGGMEHQTMTGMGNFEFYLVAHELGHSWFGDYVTCATWQDIWINEGFATYSQYLAMEYLAPQYAEAEKEYWFGRALREPEGRVFIPANEANSDSRIFSGNLSYGKGMALVHMIRFELQDDPLFFRVLREYLERYANDVATGMDFKKVLEETSGRDFTDFFNQWYFGAGYPVYDLTWQQEGDQLTLFSTQSGSSESNPIFKMSMEYRIFYPGGDTTVRVFQSQSSETYRFTLSHPADSVQIDPDNHVLNSVSGIQENTQSGKRSSLFNVYPNPTRGSITFCVTEGTENTEYGEEVTVEMFNSLGQIQLRRKFEGCLPSMPYIIETAGLSNGVYFMRIGNGECTELKKILVE